MCSSVPLPSSKKNKCTSPWWLSRTLWAERASLQASTPRPKCLISAQVQSGGPSKRTQGPRSRRQWETVWPAPKITYDAFAKDPTQIGLQIQADFYRWLEDSWQELDARRQVLQAKLDGLALQAGPTTAHAEPQVPTDDPPLVVPAPILEDVGLVEAKGLRSCTPSKFQQVWDWVGEVSEVTTLDHAFDKVVHECFNAPQDTRLLSLQWLEASYIDAAMHGLAKRMSDWEVQQSELVLWQPPQCRVTKPRDRQQAVGLQLQQARRSLRRFTMDLLQFEAWAKSSMPEGSVRNDLPDLLLQVWVALRVQHHVLVQATANACHDVTKMIAMLARKHKSNHLKDQRERLGAEAEVLMNPEAAGRSWGVALEELAEAELNHV